MDADPRRKPPNVTFPGWVEYQVRRAEAEGAFKNLPGAGRPIPDLDQQPDELAWLANYLHRENVDVVDVLPPALRLAKEVETLDERLAAIASEIRVRAVIDHLNHRIDVAYARPQVGPPLRVKKVRVEEAVQRWRATRPAPAAAAPATPTAPVAPVAPVAPPRRWRRRRA